MASTGNAEWHGDLKGDGEMAVESGAFDVTFTSATRFEDDPGTNPEELIGAAHAGCFSMALSNMLAEDGHTPDAVKTSAKVTIKLSGGDPSISKIELTTEGTVPGIDDATFKEYAEKAKAGCPVSKALAGVPEITLDAKLA